MPKWEYGNIRVMKEIDEQNDTSEVMLVAILLSDDPVYEAPKPYRVLRELNKLGKEGWEVIAVTQGPYSLGQVTNYLLKRPLVE